MLRVPLLLKELWRTGQLKLFSLSLMFIVASFVSSDQIYRVLDNNLDNKIRNLTGADRSVVSWKEIPENWVASAQQNNLNHATLTQLGSMLSSKQGFHLASVQAIDEHYPLAGELVIGDSIRATSGKSNLKLTRNNIWLSKRLANDLQVDVGNKVHLGNREFHVSGIILNEPGASVGITGIAPKAIISIKVINDIGLIRPGARIQYQLLLSGSETNLKQFETWINEKLEPGQQWRNPQRSSNTRNLLHRIRTYLGISTMVALLLGITSLAFSGFHFAESQRKRVSLWRCLGISRFNLLKQYMLVLLAVGTMSGLLGVVFGQLMSHFVLQKLTSYINVTMSAFNLLPAPMSVLGSLLMIAVFLFPTLIQLSNQSPLNILRPETGRIKLPWTHWIPGMLYVAAIAYYWSDNAVLWSGFSIGLLFLLLILFLLGKLMHAGFSRVINNPISRFRMMGQFMKTNRNANLLKMLVLSMILSLFGIVYLMSQALFSQWQQELPPETPNTFIFNVAPEEVTPIQNDLKQLSINTTNWFPIARGRISKINSKPVDEVLNSDQQQDNALKRELNLTFSNQLDPANKTFAGFWPPAKNQIQNGVFPISIESGLLNRLGLQLHDRIEFTIGASVRIGEIIHIRKVNWGTFKPNFFIIFPKQAQQDLFVTYLCSFFVDNEQQFELDNTLKKYHSVSMIPVGKVLDQVRSIISEAGKMVQFSMSFIAILSFILLLTVLQMTAKQKLFQGLIIRAVGGSNRLIRRLLFSEWLILGLLSGWVAAFFVETGFNFIAAKLLELELSFHPDIWVGLPVFATIILILGGQGLKSRLLQQSPMMLLKEQAGQD